MIHAMVQLTVDAFDQFWAGFTTRGLPLREAHGSLGAHVFRHADDPSRVTLLFRWATREQMVGFFDDPHVRESQRGGGMLGPPTITVLEPVGELPA